MFIDFLIENITFIVFEGRGRKIANRKINKDETNVCKHEKLVKAFTKTPLTFHCG